MIFILICRWFQKSNPRDQHSNGQIWRFEQTSRYSTERTVFMQKMMKKPAVYECVVHTADVREEWDRLQYYWWHDPDFTILRESVHNDSPLLTDKQNSWEHRMGALRK